jgi:hypothetical protein
VPLLDERDPGPFSSAVLLVALDGWVNAGSAGTLAAETAAGEGRVVVSFDADSLYDYRMMRPTIDFEDGQLERVEWPELTIRCNNVGGRDLLVMTGGEPNWNWRKLADELAAWCGRAGVTEFVGIGGVPWAAPHTRPTTVMATSTERSRLTGFSDHPEGLLRVPGSAVNGLEWEIHKAGIPTIGFWARVPNYVGAAYPAAAMALLERLSGHLGVAFVLDDLAAAAQEQRGQLDAIAEQRADVKAMVDQLEQVHDSSLGVSGEDLAAEIERFLRGRE